MSAAPVITPRIPPFLSHLLVWHGLVVPYAQLVVDGVPDFRIIDHGLALKCVQKHLCGICGGPLGERCYMIAGLASRASRMFKDPPMHKPCAEWSIAQCPFLTGKHKGTYSERELPVVEGMTIQLDERIAPMRPITMCLMSVYTKTVWCEDRSGTIHTGRILGTRYF